MNVWTIKYRPPKSKSLHPVHDNVTLFWWMFSFEYVSKAVMSRVCSWTHFVVLLIACHHAGICYSLGHASVVVLLNLQTLMQLCRTSVTNHTATLPRTQWFDDSHEVACFTTAFFNVVTTITLLVSWEQSRIRLFSNRLIGFRMFKKKMADNVKSQSHSPSWLHCFTCLCSSSSWGRAVKPPRRFRPQGGPISRTWCLHCLLLS